MEKEENSESSHEEKPIVNIQLAEEQDQTPSQDQKLKSRSKTERNILSNPTTENNTTETEFTPKSNDAKKKVPLEINRMRRNTETNVMSKLRSARGLLNDVTVKTVVELKVLNEVQRRRMQSLRRKSHTVELTPLNFCMADKINAQEHVKVRQKLETSFTIELASVQNEEEKKEIKRRQSKILFKAMKSLDTCNERAPEKLTEGRRSSMSPSKSPSRKNLLPRVSEHKSEQSLGGEVDERETDSMETPYPRGTVHGTLSGTANSSRLPTPDR